MILPLLGLGCYQSEMDNATIENLPLPRPFGEPLFPAEVVSAGSYTMTGDDESIGLLRSAALSLFHNPVGVVYLYGNQIPQPELDPNDPLSFLDQLGVSCEELHGCLIPSFGHGLGSVPTLLGSYFPDVPLQALGDNPIERLVRHLGMDLGYIGDLYYLMGSPSQPPALHINYLGVEVLANPVYPGPTYEGGVSFLFELEFPEHLAADASCECPFHSTNPLLQKGCDAFFDIPGVCEPLPAPPFDPIEGCTGLDLHFKVNRIRFEVRFAPEFRRPSYDGDWTETLFQDARFFRLTDKFTVTPYLVVRPLDVLYAESPGDVDSDTSHDLAVYADPVCGPGFEATCQMLAEANGLENCSQFIGTTADLGLSIHSTDPDDRGLTDTLTLVSKFNSVLDHFRFADAAPPEEGALRACTPPAGSMQDIVTELSAVQDVQGLSEVFGCDLVALLDASLTYVKWHWFLAPFGPFPNGTWLPVTGIVVTPSTYWPGWGWLGEITFQFDNDAESAGGGDGVLTPWDNCPFDYNPSQADGDGDGIGDVCDLCPEDWGNDWDFDGVCGDIDNCPVAANPGQENCNEVAESVHSPDDVLGDACDPVPCPRDLGAPRWVTDYEANNDKFWVRCGWTIDDDLKLRPLQSHPREFGVPVPVPGKVGTSARFCQVKPSLGIWCDQYADASDDLLSSAGCAPLADGSAPCANHEVPGDRYHRVTFSAGGNGMNPNGDVPLLDYVFSSESSQALDPSASVPAGLNWRWSYDGDFQRWTDPDVQLLLGLDNVSQLKGTLWLHADTAVGDVLDLGTGLHGSELANNYDLGRKPETYECVQGTKIAFTPKHFFLWQTLPDPPYEERIRWDTEPWETNILVELEDGEWGAIDSRGNAQIITERFGTRLRSALADPLLTWTSAAEPIVLQGAGARFPQAVALAQQGAVIADVVTSDGLTLYAQGDGPTCGADGPALPVFEGEWSIPGGAAAVPTPVALDVDGYVYVADVRLDRVLVYANDGTFVEVWGAPGTGAGNLASPAGVAVDGAGNVYVSEQGNDRVSVFGPSGGGREMLYAWGTAGAGDGEFQDPAGIAFDAGRDRIYVVDRYNHRVQWFDRSGTFLGKFGSYGTAEGQFDTPSDVAVDHSGRVYVTDSRNDRVQVFDSEGQFLLAWGEGGNGDGQFVVPSGIALDREGMVYVTDPGNDRIQVFDEDGAFLFAWGDTGSAEGEFRLPQGIAVDAASNVYIADTQNSRIQKFSQGTARCVGCPSGLCQLSSPETCCELACDLDAECPSGYCSPLSGTCAYPPLAGSPRASGYVPVLTRMRRGVFVVGGEDPTTGMPTGEVWFALLGSSHWESVPVEFSPQTVLAATYSFASDALYVLDETSDGRRRLWEHEMTRHVSTLVGSWSSHSEWDRHWLTVDLDGAVLLASSSSARKEHAIARIDVARGTRATVVGSLRGHRELMLAPVVDRSGYTMVLRKSQGQCRGGGNCLVERQRRRTLEFAPSDTASLGAQL